MPAVYLEHTHPYPSCLRMGIHKRHDLVESILANDGIGIEQQHIVARTLSYGNVVGACKTEIVVTAYNVD